MIGIITAMSCEADYFKTVMTDTEQKKIGAWSFTTGSIGSTKAVLAVCGVGKVFAGSCAQTMISAFDCDHIYNVGVAGSLDKNVKIGDIVSAKATVQHDMDTTAVGDPIGLISGLNIVEMPCDETFTEKFERFVSSKGKILRKGIIATGDKFFKLTSDKELVSERFGAVAGEMEGGAVGQMCIANNVPYNVIRMITDNAGEDSGNEYAVNLEECAVDLASTFADFIRNN